MKKKHCIRQRPGGSVSALAMLGLLSLCVQPAIVGGGRLLAQAPNGPDTTSSTTDDSTGMVTAVSASAITVSSKRRPFTYRLGLDLHVVGSDHASLTIRDVRKGQKVTVYYYLRDGQPTVARIAILTNVAGKDKDR